MKIYKGHDPREHIAGTDIPGVDLLLTEYDDGTFELAVRPGLDQTHITWGPPSLLTEVPS